MASPVLVANRRVRALAVLWLVLFAVAAFVVWSQTSVVDYTERRASASFGTVVVCVGPIVDRAPTCLGEVHPGPIDVLIRSGSAATVLTAVVVGADWLRRRRGLTLGALAR